MTWRAFGDWGTSTLRLYRIDEDGRMAARSQGPGIGGLGGAPGAILRAAIEQLAGGPIAADRPAEIRLCGMAGSRTGLAEAPYAECPADAADWAKLAIGSECAGVALRIAAGLSCKDTAGRPDVMRGEEAQVYGAIGLDPHRSAGRSVYVLPGTHSKWAIVEDGRIVAFRTLMSGELFAMLAGSSLLALEDSGAPGEQDDGFAAGLDRVLGGDGLTASLFSARTLQLRAGHSRQWATGYLSGLVIGDEVAAMRRLAGLPSSVTLIGAPALCARYEQALAHAGVNSARLDGEACVLKGLELLDDWR